LFCSLALNSRNFDWPSSKENWKLPLAEGPSLPAKVSDGKVRVITANAARAAKIILFMGGSLFWTNLERVYSGLAQQSQSGTYWAVSRKGAKSRKDAKEGVLFFATFAGLCAFA
jgi:hypothetical protein